MDLKQYAAAKAAKSVVLMKIGPATVAVGIPQFDPQTGVPRMAMLEQFNLQTVDEIIAPVKEQLDALIAFRADVAAALQEVAP